MRIFVGINIPSEVKSSIEAEADKVLKHTKSYKKSVSKNYHLTLKFIGEMKISDIITLDQLLAKSLKESSSFEIHLKDIGYFENDNEYILFVGVHQGVGYLNEIQQIIDQQTSEVFGIKRTKLEPHITVARNVVVDNKKVLKKNKTKNYSFKVDEISIYYSHRDDGILKYTALSNIKLN